MDKKEYKISKINSNSDTPYSEYSRFGNTQDYFKGISTPPVIGERFILRDEEGDIVINTSPIVEIGKDFIKTIYSIYSLEELS